MRRQVRIATIAGCMFLAAVGAAIMPSCSPAEASPGRVALEIAAEQTAAAISAGTVFDITRAATAAGPGFVDSFTVACGNSATSIASSLGQVAYTCQNPSTTRVAVGDSTIKDPVDGGGQNSPTYCATNCPAQEWNASARQEYCRADATTDAGTVTIYCRALVSTGSAP